METIMKEQFAENYEDISVVGEEKDEMDATLKETYDFLDVVMEKQRMVDHLKDVYPENEYTNEFRQKKAKEIFSALDAQRIAKGNKILSIMDERIKKEQDIRKLREGDVNHQILVQNALSMLQLLGDKITSDQANNIISPFAMKKDIPTLSIIQSHLRNLHLPDHVMKQIQFVPDPETALSEEERHSKMKEVFIDVFFSKEVKFMSSMETVISLQLYGEAYGYFKRGGQLVTEQR